MERVTLLCVFALAAAAVVTAQKCDDIDTNACNLIHASRPDLCSDPTLSQTACPRFCKLCPVECYHCNATVMDFHECNTTKLCGEGEVCMKKELLSFVDGHHEYQMTCERKELCDGAGVGFPFVGKRSVESRDVTLTCCSDDLCNYPGSMPAPPATTHSPLVATMAAAACKRDVIFVVDESRHMSEHETRVIQFVSDMVNKLQIGSNAALVSMATYSTTARTRWDLNRYSTNADLQQAIQNMVFNGGSGDNAAALTYLMNHATTVQAGDRPDAPDAVVIITADSTAHTFQNAVLESSLHRAASDVIVIGLSRKTDASDLNHLATDNGHVFRLVDDSLLSAAESKIFNLICPKA